MIYIYSQVIELDNKIVKYFFTIIVIVLIFFGIYQMGKDKETVTNESLDQTSTASTIQTNLRFGISNFDTFNPILSNNRNVQQISKNVFEPLITLNNNYKLQYCLATEIAKIDELNYVIKLRDNVTWHNGSKFTSDDVKFTIDMLRNGTNSVYSNNVNAITYLEKVDEYTLKITLSYPIDFFEYNLTFPILCANNFNEENSESNNLSGTGIFKISKIDSNVITLIKNENYWNKERNSMSNEININLYNNAGEMYDAFKNGDIDILDVKVANYEDYIGTLGYKKIEYRSRNFDFVAFNTQNEVLSDVSVRKAISKVIDKNNIVASCLGAGYISSNFSLDMGEWLYTKNLNIEVNTDEAKQILIDNGWTFKNNRCTKYVNNRTIELAFTLAVNGNNSTRVKVAENIKNQLENFGIRVSIKQLNNEAYSNAISNKNYDAVLTGITCGFSPSLATFFGNDNLSNYHNQEVTDIMNIVSNTKDENMLYQKYNRLYDIYLEEAPYIGLYRNTDFIIYNQNLVGNIQANAFNIYCNIEKWYRQ